MIAVIGGGLIGSCVAFELSQAGYEVTVVEAGLPGAAWKASAGLLTPSNERLEGRLHAEAQESLRLWPEFAARLERVSGQSVGYRAAGPGWSDFLPGEGQVYPPAVREAALTGLKMLPGRVSGIGQDGAGLRLLVSRDDGAQQTLRPRGAVLACGAWSAAFGLPVRAVQGQALILRGDTGRAAQYRPARRGFSLYALGRPDGVYLGATSRESREVQPDSRAQSWLGLAARRLLGEEAPHITEHLVGLRPVTPVGQPLVGPHSAWPGVYVATGHGRHGALLAPLTARRCLEWLHTQHLQKVQA